MLKTLRGRLLSSYILVIVITLLVIGVTLFLTATSADVRFLPALQRLATIGQSNRNELQRLQLRGADEAELIAVLQRTADDNGVRIAIAGINNGQIVFDSDNSQTWLGVTIGQATRPTRLVACAEPGNIGGLLQFPDRSFWLVCSQLSGTARILYAQPAPTRRSFFRQFFSQPLSRSGLIALLPAILLAAWIARSVTRPLHQMATAAESISDGDYDQQIPIEGPEEVKRVGVSFNRMVTQVHLSQQAQRDFVANVSHDLKTPITSIRGWSQALLDGTAVSVEEQQQAATIIYNEAERMSRMVTQLLDLARIESGQIVLKKEAVDLSQLFTDIHHSLQPRAQDEGIHLTLEAEPVFPIKGDYDRLVQLFTNLVDNALTHTATGGRVHLTVHPHDVGAVEAVVQDTGKGIPAEQLSRIFERFYQVDKSHKGSGLGLAIVKELVEAHNGRIQARSQVGKGSAFIVRLPVSDIPEGTTIIRRQDIIGDIK